MLWDYDVIALDPTFCLQADAASTETLQARSVGFLEKEWSTGFQSWLSPNFGLDVLYQREIVFIKVRISSTSASQHFWKV